MSIPTITVIIPVKNNPAGIALLLESLENQTLSKDQLEIIVINNGSTDHTKEIVKQFPVKLYIEKRPGSYAARNLGIKKAKGRYIAFIDSDCLATPKWLENGIKALSIKSVSAIAGQIKFIFKRSNPNIYEYLDSANKLNQKSYTQTGFSATANMFIKKEIFIKELVLKLICSIKIRGETHMVQLVRFF